MSSLQLPWIEEMRRGTVSYLAEARRAGWKLSPAIISETENHLCQKHHRWELGSAHATGGPAVQTRCIDANTVLSELKRTLVYL